MNEYIYLSPHLDDVVLSCGAIIWDQVRRHESVKIWTIFAGDPPQKEFSPFAREIHKRWNTGPEEAVSTRRAEDRLACERLQVIPLHLSYLDCIYHNSSGTAQPLIENNEDLFQNLPDSEQPLVDEIAQQLRQVLPAACTLVIPLAIGNHIDHQIVRRVGKILKHSAYYYADFPYSSNHPEEIHDRAPVNSPTYHFPLNNQSLAVWQYAVEAYTSQLSSFWPSLNEMYEAVEAYAKSAIGNCLWQANND
jgi:LmbE family N-acetylglucosaminyl deacetylase